MSSTATSKSPHLIKHFRIALRRSTIGLPHSTRRVAQALGLKRLHYPVYRQQSPTIAGMILKLRSVVDVKECYIPEGMSGRDIGVAERRSWKKAKGFDIKKPEKPWE